MMNVLRRLAPGTLPWLAAALLLLLALADPHAPVTQLRWQHVVIVDITQSMNTLDMRIGGSAGDDSRLAFARRALQQALADLPCGSALGLGVFTEYRSLLLLAPLEVCAHYDELLAVIERIDGRMAWAASSEVSRGVFSAMQVTQGLADRPSLVFISDGHESPPLRAGRLPNLDLPARPVLGWVAGVGGDIPAPIPKIDPSGRPLGVWQADDVMQSDPSSLGRTIGGAQQSLVDNDGAPLQAYEASGIEHLSSLKQAHLQAVADAAGLRYRRLRDVGDLSAAMRAPELARPVKTQASWRWLPALAALVLLGWTFFGGYGSRRRA
jgi:mxaL protein